ncbi:hypothetical protein [Bacillus cereus]|uniref:hypothetical protein n=1 Tax=Bacillus cereus TaxID=1396 RepID=UPI000BFDCDF1|nr:hypothetical protein [Bacillus cereus]PGV23052.1 hypothetical protein COD93_29745 [Bacillus cereus]
MALKRKKIQNKTLPVKCSQCKEIKAFHTMHGGYVHGGGKTCCNECYPAIQKEENRLIQQDDGHMSEADYQSWGRLQ